MRGKVLKEVDCTHLAPKQVLAILTADWHLRDDVPSARTDDYWLAQERKVAFVSNLQREHGCPVLIAGDLFHKHSPSPFLLQWAITNLPDRIICVPGNHDIPNHNMAMYERSGLAVLEAAGKVKVLNNGYTVDRISGFAYGDPLIDKKAAEVVMLHEMLLTDDMHPLIEGYSANQLRDIFPDADLILTGHNHTPLFDTDAEPLVLNPGSLMRMTAAQGDFHPTVWLWYADENRVEPITIPHEPGIISRDHIDVPEERDERMSAFVDRLRNDIEIGLSFKSNLQQYMTKNKIDELVKKTVWEAVG